MAPKKKTLPVAVVEKHVSQTQGMVANLVISDQISYDGAAELLLIIKQRYQETMDALDPQREAAYNSYIIARDQRDKYTKPLELLEKQVKEKMSLFLQQQEEKRRIEEKLAREEAEKEAEVIRQKLLAKAKKAKTEEKREELEEQAEMVVAHTPSVSLGITATEGTAHRFVDKVTVVDLKKLIWAIANGVVTINVDKLFSVKGSVLDDYVKLTGNTAIPGCVVDKKPVISASKG